MGGEPLSTRSGMGGVSGLHRPRIGRITGGLDVLKSYGHGQGYGYGYGYGNGYANGHGHGCSYCDGESMGQ